MKGLVLAGGAGTRLRPLTWSGAKQLVPVANRPVLFYVIDNLVAAKITDIGIILSPETGAEVRSALGDGSSWGASFTFIVQDRPAGLAHAVLSASDFLGSEDFCMFLGDNLIGSAVGPAVEHFRAHPELSATVFLKEVDDPSRFGVAEIDAEGRVTCLVEKPVLPKSNLALVGIYLFRPAVLRAAREIVPSPRGELEITDAISWLLHEGGEVHVEHVGSWWLDTGKKDDLLLANETVLDDWLRTDIKGKIDKESTISGRVAVAEGAVIERSTVRGPVVIGRGAKVIDSHIGPFTSVGDGVTVLRSGIDRSVIMQGAVIEDTPRLEDSLIGRRVVVQPGASRVGALSLLVGDDSRVELARRS